MIDPVAREVSRWVETRPSSDEFTQAIGELQDVIVFAKMNGVYVGSASLESVIRWLFVASQLPLEWLENELRWDYLNGSKKR